jgi:hypothetical protein
VIARQRPGTAKGFVFLSIEDETGISNAIITPKLFERIMWWWCISNFAYRRAAAKSGQCDFRESYTYSAAIHYAD